MRSPWITWLGRKANDRCSYRRYTDKRHSGQRPREDGGRDWSGSHKPWNTWGPPGVGRGRKGPPLEPPQEARPCRCLDFGLLASRMWESKFLLL